MSSPIKPTIGRVVLVAIVVAHSVMLAPALVNAVHSDTAIGVTAFPYNAYPVALPTVTYHEPQDGEEWRDMTWHWMPYQLGQAKKTEQSEAKELAVAVAAVPTHSGQFRKKPVVIEARQCTESTTTPEELAEWCGGEVVRSDRTAKMAIDIPTLEGTMRAEYGDWIIKGVKGEFYPCKPDIFAATYDALVIPNTGDDEALPDVDATASGDFAFALTALKNGCRVARSGWNGKGMFVMYQKGYPDGIPINANTAEATGLPEGTVCVFRPYFSMKAADGTFVPWVASVTDLLANDWEIVAD